MNQGNDAGHRGDDGVFQDGAVLFHFPSTGWVGFFIAFNSQVWFTDDQHGHRLPGFPEGPLALLDTHPGPTPIPPPPRPPVPAPVVSPLAIIAALVNPEGTDEGKETVTIFNASAQAVDLRGWKIIDRQQGTETLEHRMLPSNESVTIRLSGRGAQLGNQGGTIRLVSPEGVQTDSVSYSAAQASHRGQIIRF
jgi:hypothetical protein